MAALDHGDPQAVRAAVDLGEQALDFGDALRAGFEDKLVAAGGDGLGGTEQGLDEGGEFLGRAVIGFDDGDGLAALRPCGPAQAEEEQAPPGKHGINAGSGRPAPARKAPDSAGRWLPRKTTCSSR